MLKTAGPSTELNELYSLKSPFQRGLPEIHNSFKNIMIDMATIFKSYSYVPREDIGNVHKKSRAAYEAAVYIDNMVSRVVKELYGDITATKNPLIDSVKKIAGDTGEALEPIDKWINKKFAEMDFSKDLSSGELVDKIHKSNTSIREGISALMGEMPWPKNTPALKVSSTVGVADKTLDVNRLITDVTTVCYELDKIFIENGKEMMNKLKTNKQTNL
jgi:hypothetical protein